MNPSFSSLYLRSTVRRKAIPPLLLLLALFCRVSATAAQMAPTFSNPGGDFNNSDGSFANSPDSNGPFPISYEVVLEWDASPSQDVIGHLVYRRRANETEWIIIGKTVAPGAYLLAQDGDIFFVTAFNSCCESEPSNQATFQAPGAVRAL